MFVFIDTFLPFLVVQSDECRVIVVIYSIHIDKYLCKNKSGGSMLHNQHREIAQGRYMLGTHANKVQIVLARRNFAASVMFS